jgi:phosphoribosylformimino-5-aminoimidazole carboxamide ribotide isomerase
MLLIPAIDLKDGKCVRLVKGQFDQLTVYGDDPTLMAIHWEDLGAPLIHLVDLDASLGKNTNQRAIYSIREATKAQLQLGGGIKDFDTVKKWIDCGIDRLIMGTAAVENPSLVRKASDLYPGKIAVALDSSGKALKTWGWLKDSGKTLMDVAGGLKDLGVSLVIHTDVDRDGTQEGPNIDLTKEVSEVSGLPTIISGGIKDIEDLKDIKTKIPSIYGVISGKALYSKSLDFKEGFRQLA